MKKKDSKSLQVVIPTKLMELLDDYCAEHFATRGEVVKQALAAFIKSKATPTT